MRNRLDYKGFSGSVQFNMDDNQLFGRIQDIQHIVVYQGKTASELTMAFQAAVEKYIQFCAENSVSTGKSYSGSISIRVTKELHKRAAMAAYERDITLNALVSEAIQLYLI
jgi:predicted HicB family RNase H-like nuclease